MNETPHWNAVVSDWRDYAQRLRAELDEVTAERDKLATTLAQVLKWLAWTMNRADDYIDRGNPDEARTMDEINDYLDAWEDKK